MGEAPNRDGKEKYETRSGRRMAEMAGARLPWWNIHAVMPPHWSERVAQARVIEHITMTSTFDTTEPFILLGRRVCAAFEVPGDAEWLDWYRTMRHRHPMIVFPHPSGMNRWWNDKDNAERAADLLRSVAKGELPYVMKKVVGTT